MKRMKNIYVGTQADAPEIVRIILNFLVLFMPMTLAKRVVSIILIAAGLPISRITEMSGLTQRSVRSFGKKIREGDTESLLKLKEGRGRKGKAADVEEQILAELEKGNYHTRQQIADMVKEKFHISMSVSAIGKFLKRNGLHRLKSGSLPAKADTVKQREFYEATLLPLMKKAKKGDIALLFMDASHFVLGCDFLGYIYGRTRRFVRTFSGRMRYNVLGTIDFVSKKVTTVTNDKYITAEQVREMLSKISQEYAGKTTYLLLDNARYQKCKAVQESAAKLHIQLVYIPPYSPNLNLIERLWKFVKGELRTKYYDNFTLFREKIDSIIASTTQENHARICKLIDEKVQLFDSLQLVSENVYEAA